MSTIRNYGILVAIENAISEGKFFAVEGYLEYCPICRWHREPFCTHGSKGKSKRFTARIIRNTEGREEVFVFLMGEPVLIGLIPVQRATFEAAREDLRPLILKSIRDYLPWWMTEYGAQKALEAGSEPQVPELTFLHPYERQ